MPRKEQPWFRAYVEMPTDPKVRRLSPEQRWVWVAVMAAARRSPVVGSLFVAEDLPMSMAELADYAGVPERKVRAALDLMQQLGMVRIGPGGLVVVVNFLKRQFLETDTSTQRVRKHRLRNVDETFQPGALERSKPVSGNVSGTAVGTGFSRARATETETETDPGTAERNGGGGVEPREPPPPDTPPCPRHPHGTSTACADCRNHRLATETRQSIRAAETAAANLTAQLAIDNCPRCDDTGWITIERPGQPDAGRRCNHQPEARTA